jgi:tRNA-dihydrouridine synthase B
MNKIYIDDLEIEKVIPAPLSGYTDYPFRKILKNCGADLICTEMVSVESIVRKNKNADSILYFDDFQRPVSLQLFGNNPLSFAKAVDIILNKNIVPDIIDINMGCSVRKILKSKSGSFLLTEPDKVKQIISSIKRITDIPVTAKIRAGWDNNSINFLEISKILEDNGCSAIIFHPRTTKDLFKNFAKWEYIKELKKNINIPVIGNGDIRAEEDAEKMLRETNCDGIMIGRGIIGNPFIINNTINYLKNKKKLKIKLTYLFETIKMHLEYIEKFYGKSKYITFRKHLFKYLKGFYIKKILKEKLLNINSINDLEKILLLIGEINIK